MAEILKVKGLVKRYKELIAIDHLDMSIKEGEIFGLLGPNGSGKSTTINCIPKAYEIKRQIGIVPQDVAVYDALTVYENIDFFCGLYIKDKETRKKYVQEAIDFVALNDFVKFKPNKLSGGLKRRLNIACGIALTSLR